MKQPSEARMKGSRIAQQFATLVFPIQCPFCKKQSIESIDEDVRADCDQPWCDDCFAKLVGNPLDRCLKCGASSGPKNPFPQGCRLCHGVDLRFERCFAIGNYRGDLQELVVKMKRCHDDVLAIQLGRLLGYQLDTLENEIEFDMVIPIPTHWWRKFSRGFHGASVIADGISGVCGIRKSQNVLHCRRTTRKQGMLTTAGRFANVRGAFGLNERVNIRGKNVLLVDDVMTSGATASEATKTLYKGGAERVIVAVAARGAKAA